MRSPPSQVRAVASPAPPSLRSSSNVNLGRTIRNIPDEKGNKREHFHIPTSSRAPKTSPSSHYILLILCLIALLSTQVAAQFTPPAPPPPKLHDVTRAQIDPQFQSFIDGGYCPGIIVGIVEPSGQHIYSYGAVAQGSKQAPDENTIFEIGSLTQLITGTAYAEMVEQKQIKRSQDVDSLLPNMKIPAFGGNKIWLSYLATQTSGLPLNPTNLTSSDPHDPYMGYTQRQFVDFLANAVIPRPPGDRFEYSNVGYALLADALAAVEKKSVEQTLIERVCKPLEMNDSNITISDAAKPRFAHAYTVDGDEVNHWDCQPLAGAIGFKSTMKDLLKFCSATVGLTKSPLADAMKSMQERQIDTPDRQNDMGIAWLIGRKFDVLWLNGQTGGHHAFIACLPKQKAAIVILANSSFAYVDGLGTNIIKLMNGQEIQPLVLTVPKNIDPSVLAQYDGEYIVDPTTTLTVSHDGSKLYIQANKQQKLRIYAAADNIFFGKAVQCAVEFPKDGPIDQLTFRQNGHDTVARKSQ